DPDFPKPVLAEPKPSVEPKAESAPAPIVEPKAEPAPVPIVEPKAEPAPAAAKPPHDEDEDDLARYVKQRKSRAPMVVAGLVVVAVVAVMAGVFEHEENVKDAKKATPPAQTAVAPVASRSPETVPDAGPAASATATAEVVTASAPAAVDAGVA